MTSPDSRGTSPDPHTEPRPPRLVLETVQMERGGTSTRITDEQGRLIAAVGAEDGRKIVAAVNDLLDHEATPRADAPPGLDRRRLIGEPLPSNQCDGCLGTGMVEPTYRDGWQFCGTDCAERGIHWVMTGGCCDPRDPRHIARLRAEQEGEGR